ncbi:MAG: PAS domain S-box protein [Proteobacteria bacterium]|nr:PAS domain S-box protein [Pseudomonadota bacterium]
MKDKDKTKTQLINELAVMHQRITELEKSETELKQEKEIPWKSEEKYRALIEHASDAIIVADSKGNFLEVNKKAEDLLGYSRKELVGMNPRHIHPKEELKKVIHDFSRMAAGEIHFCYDTKVLRKDGRLVPVDITGTPVEYNGRTLVQGIFRDITEHKQIEEELKKATEKYRDIFENAMDGIFHTTPEGQSIIVNPATAKLLGYASPEDLIRSVKDMGTQIYAYPEDRDKALRLMEDHGFIENFEAQFRRKDGSIVWGLLNAHPICDQKGNILYIQGTVQDINKRKLAEEALRGEEARYRDLADSLPQTVVECDDKGHITFANFNSFKIFGYTKEDFKKGLNIFQMIVPEDHDRARKNILRVSLGKQQVGNDYTAVKKDGSTFPVLIYTSAIIREKKPVDLRIILIDITERKRAEEALRESEEKYRSIFENAIEGMYQASPGGRYISVNPALARMHGFESPQEMITTVTDIGSQIFISPEARKQYREILEKKGTVVNFEFELYRKDRSKIWVSTNARVVRNKDGETLYYEGKVEDITERKRVEEALKRSESRLSSIIEFLPDATFVINLEGKIISWNRAIEEMTGFSVEMMLGKGDYEYAIPFYGERRPILVNFLFLWDDDIAKKYSFIRKDGDTLYTETDVPYVRGQNRTLWAKASPLYDAKGNVIGAIESIRDITERKRLETELMHAQKMEAIGTLSGGIAHDFNNILMGIQGYASLMMLDISTEHPHYERLKRIEEQVKNASDLTGQLLGFARGGKYVVKPVNMNELIEKTSNMFGRTKKEIAIHRKYERDIWAVEADMGQIEQVLLNLYLNAWQAMPAGGDLSIETKNIVVGENYTIPYSTTFGRYVRISISDTGVGMNEKTKERIFEPFFTTKELGRGTGLGLAMVYGIIKNHNGFIDVISEPDKGTTFALYFPASEKDIAKETSGVPEIMRGTETILVVDDEPDVLAVSKNILESLGYNVYGVKNGEEAIILYKEKKDVIDLIVLDMIMPGLSGSETFDRIRELNSSARIILCSGYSLNDQAQQIMDKGCHGFIQKPFNIANISMNIRKVLEK